MTSNEDKNKKATQYKSMKSGSPNDQTSNQYQSFITSNDQKSNQYQSFITSNDKKSKQYQNFISPNDKISNQYQSFISPNDQKKNPINTKVSFQKAKMENKNLIPIQQTININKFLNFWIALTRINMLEYQFLIN